jgi:hypothetical protein
MSERRGLVARLGAPAVLTAAFSAANAAEPLTVGWIERVALGSERVLVAAKLDTGADTSSLHAADLRFSSRADGDWVSFEVTGHDGAATRFERKIVRVARVRRASGGSQSRPVVMMGVCLGRVYRTTEVNLTDRSGFNYEFLIGRSFLAPNFAVDSARINTIEPECPETRRR